MLLALVIAALAASDSPWAQWRGPDGLGVSHETGFPTEWSPTENVRFKTEIPGRGHSSPVVWGDRIFLLTSIEGPIVPGAKAVDHIGWDGEDGYVHPDSVGADHAYTMQVLAVDRRTGKIVWTRTAYEGAVYDSRHRKNTYASSTPPTDGRYLYAFFDAEGLYCYDFDGNLVWKRSIGKIAKGGMGPGMSPVLYENLVIVQCDLELGKGSFIVALDKKTGDEVWRRERRHRRSWATPVLIRSVPVASGPARRSLGEGGPHAQREGLLAPERVELVASGAETVVSYDPATGKELWQAKGTESHPIPSAVFGHGMVFLSAGSQAKRAMAIRLGGSGDLTDTADVVWRYAKGTAYVPSPILYEDYLYLMTDKGLVTCLDAQTGEVKYEGGRVPVPATFTASPVAFEGKILLTSEDGDTFVLKAGPVHEVLRTNSVGEPVFASPALSGGEIFIRGEKHLFAIAAPAAKTRVTRD